MGFGMLILVSCTLDDPPMEEESSSFVCSLSPSPSLSCESTGDTDGGEDFTNEEVYVLDATNLPKEMVTSTSQQLQSMLSIAKYDDDLLLLLLIL